MAFYTTALSPGDFLPLFQLMDDYHDSRRPQQSPSAKHTTRGKQAPAVASANHVSTPASSTRQNNASAVTPSFTPRFDVRESDSVYILDGELPGAHQENIEIEFTDAETIVIKGRVERNYESLINNKLSSEDLHDEKDDDAMSVHSDGASSTHSNYHSPTVEDDEDENANGVVKVPVKKSSTTVTKNNKNNKSQQVATQQKPEFKYWASERSTGTFQRSFTFPARVDQERVKAILRNGILSVTVPKRTFQQAKRVRIE